MPNKPRRCPISDLIRPTARKALTRWREALIGLGIVLFGTWLTATTFGITRYLGVAVIIGGLIIVREGWMRARRPAEGGGAGVVEVDERQITYLAPKGGGTVSINALSAVDVITNDAGPDAPDLFWLFTTRDGDTLMVPNTAEGAGAIFDALQALKGVNYQAALNAAHDKTKRRHMIWAADSKPRDVLRIH